MRPTCQPSACRSFAADTRGFTGAEKAMMIAFALAIVVLIAALVQGGSKKAAGDARSTLLAGAGGNAKLGQVIRPGAIAHAGDVQGAGTASPSSGAPPPSLSLPRPPPSQAPAAPQPKPTTDNNGQLATIEYPIKGPTNYTTVVGRDKSGNIIGLYLQRLGDVTPDHDDPRLAALGRALGNGTPARSFDGVIKFYDAKTDGGRVISNPNGTIGIDTPRSTINLFPSGAIDVYNKKDQITYGLFPDGDPRSLYDVADGTSYQFRYNDKNQFSYVKVTGGPDKDRQGEWRLVNGTWTRVSDGKKWQGPGGPDDWFNRAKNASAPPKDQPKPKFYRGDDPPPSIGNAQDLAKFVWSRYDTDHPIGIIQVKNASKPTYLITLSGTELNNPGQATFIPEDIFSSLRLDFADHYHANIINAIKAYGIPKGADVIIAGHSLGGIEAQNIASDSWFRANYNPIRVVTYGSPVTSFNPTKAIYNRFSAYNDPVANFASLASANYSFWKTAAWGGHYILKWGSFGYIDRRPVDIQTRVGPKQPHLNPLYHHSVYPTLNELQNYPIALPNGQPLQLDPGSFHTYEDPSGVLRPFFNRKVPK